jgi:hypothetical protein
VLAGLLLTEGRAISLGLVDGADPAEDLRRHLARLEDYRLAALGLGIAAIGIAGIVLAWRRPIWSFLNTRFERLERLLIPRWHLSVFFVPAFLYYGLHILLPHAIDSPAGFGHYLVQQDEEIPEFMLYVGWMIFFYLRFHHVASAPPPRRRSASLPRKRQRTFRLASEEARAPR